MSRRRKHKVSLPTHASIESLNSECEGVARINDKTTFISQALPGEKVMFEYVHKKSRYDVGRAIEIISASTERVTAKCQHFTLCGGCQLQHISAATQIREKQKTLVEQFKHIAKIEVSNLLDPIRANAWAYRRKARLGVRFVRKKGKILVGFREKNGRFLAELNGCEVLYPTIGQHLQELSEVIQSLQAFDKIAQIEVAVGDNNTALVIRHLIPLSEKDKNLLIEFSKINHFDIYLQSKGPDSVIPLYPKEPILDYFLPDFNLRFEFTPTMFTQVNYEINKKMIPQALQLLQIKNSDIVLDLFCGLGNFSLPLAKTAKLLVGIEGDKTMVAQATHNAKINKLNNTKFYTANLVESIDLYSWYKNNNYSKILIDPPRTGAAEIIRDVAKLDATRIVYVSCNPATLARDAGILVNECGYKLDSAGVLDMFPQTKHVESMALFTKK